MIEVQINKEIRDYTESLFFGLNMRQCIFSALAVGAAVGLHFLLKSYLNAELLSWVCILGALPFAAMAFFKYNGMTAEKLFVVWIRFLLAPKRLMFKPTNVYMEIIADVVEKNLKEEIPFYD